MPTDHQLDALRLLLLSEPPDYEQARAQFAPSDGSVAVLPQLVLAKNETMAFAGDLHVQGPVVLELGAQLWVAGNCEVDGVLYSIGLQYSLLVVGGTLRATTLRSAGEIFALGGLTATTLIGVYNDHSTYAPKARCSTYIAYDRVDFISELVAETRLTERDTIEYGLGLLFPSLYPRLAGEDDNAFDRRERAFFCEGLTQPSPEPVSSVELEALQAQLESADDQQRHAAHHVIRRKHLLRLAPGLAVAIRAAPSRSAEALDVLAALGAVEALTSLLDGSVAFGRAASAVARAFASAGWQTQAENLGGQWVFSVRPGADAPWRRVP